MNFFTRFMDYIIEDRSYRRAHELEMKRMEIEHEDSLIERQTICQSCETLKLEIAKLHDQNNKLIESILQKPEPEKPIDTSNIKPILPKQHMNWNTRRQMLEQNDREMAHAIRQRNIVLEDTPKTTTTIAEPLTTSQIEEELGIDIEFGGKNGN